MDFCTASVFPHGAFYRLKSHSPKSTFLSVAVWQLALYGARLVGSFSVTGYLIDPAAQTVTSVELSGTDNRPDLCRLIECQWLEGVMLSPVTFRPGEVAAALLVDEESRLHRRPKHEFQIMRLDGTLFPHAILGRGVIVGVNHEGDEVSPPLSLNRARALVRFLGAASERTIPPPPPEILKRSGFCWAIQGTFSSDGVTEPFALRRVVYRDGERIPDPEPVATGLSFVEAHLKLRELVPGGSDLQMCIATPADPTVVQIWPW